MTSCAASRLGRSFLLACAWVWLLAASGGVLAADTTSGSLKPAAAASQPGADGGWGSDNPSNKTSGGSDRRGVIREALRYDTPVVFGPAGCPVFVIGNQAWNIASAKPVVNIEHSYASGDLLAISPDGKLLAIAPQDRRPPRDRAKDDQVVVTVCSLETGTQVVQTPPLPRADLNLLVFGPDHRLIVGTGDGACQVYDARTGQRSGSLTVDRSLRKWASTPDGRYLAVAGRESLAIYNVTTGVRVLTMQSPKVEAAPDIVIPDPPPISDPKSPPPPPRSGAAAPPRQAPVGPAAAPVSAGPRAARPGKRDMPAILAGACAMSFSPDGKELAMFTLSPVPGVFVWDQQGACIFEARLRGDHTGMEPVLEWLADGSGWLVGGATLLDRQSKREVFRIPGTVARAVAAHVLDHEHFLAVVYRGANPILDTFTIPWDRIQKSLADLHSNRPANLRPGQSVSVQFEFAGLRGDKGRTRDALYHSLALCLAKEQIQIGGGQDAVFKVTFTEKAGRELPVVEQGILPFDRRDTGRTATEALCTVRVELLVNGQGRPAWSKDFEAASSRFLREEITNEALRGSMLENACGNLERISFPYFIPRTPDIEPLPIVGQ